MEWSDLGSLGSVFLMAVVVMGVTTSSCHVTSCRLDLRRLLFLSFLTGILTD